MMADINVQHKDLQTAANLGAPASRSQQVGRGALLAQRTVQQPRGAGHGRARHMPRQRIRQQRVRDAMPPRRAALPHHCLAYRTVLPRSRSAFSTSRQEIYLRTNTS